MTYVKEVVSILLQENWYKTIIKIVIPGSKISREAKWQMDKRKQTTFHGPHQVPEKRPTGKTIQGRSHWYDTPGWAMLFLLHGQGI